MAAENKHLTACRTSFLSSELPTRTASSHEAPVIRIRWIAKDYAGFPGNLNLNLDRAVDFRSPAGFGRRQSSGAS
jgi:hypothetical protein